MYKRRKRENLEGEEETEQINMKIKKKIDKKRE